MWLWQNVVDQYVQPAELIDRMLDRYLHCIPRNAGRHCPPSGSISLGNISIDQRDGDSLAPKAQSDATTDRIDAKNDSALVPELAHLVRLH